MKEFSELEKQLHIEFKNKDLLQQAFSHRSYINENHSQGLEHNERLEFLGDAVLELIVTEHLYNEHPDKPEGELTAWRAALVNTKMLARIAKEVDFNDYLLLSKGEAKEVGKSRDYILANTTEAFLGALYLDQGTKVCETFIVEHILSKLPEILEQKLFVDSKSKFQELAQEKTGITPTYDVLSEWGPDHDKSFKVGVYLEKDLIGEGEGSSKQEGEEAAAKNAIEIKQWD